MTNEKTAMEKMVEWLEEKHKTNIGASVDWVTVLKARSLLAEEHSVKPEHPDLVTGCMPYEPGKPVAPVSLVEIFKSLTRYDHPNHGGKFLYAPDVWNAISYYIPSASPVPCGVTVAHFDTLNQAKVWADLLNEIEELNDDSHPCCRQIKSWVLEILYKFKRSREND